MGAGASLKEIATPLERSPPTVPREVAQNCLRRTTKPTDGRHYAERALCDAHGLGGKGCPAGRRKPYTACPRKRRTEVCPC